ncbi:MAG: hypothetical protein K8W52_36005 [Deltaproteobacteria bacterium]|nr:hypothetical protein [Deltaproteobacteria bacterium]
MRRTAAVIAIVLAAAACTSDWQRRTHGACGPAPVIDHGPPGRWDPALNCIVTAEVERDCASRPPEQHATITSHWSGGGTPPSECQEHESAFRSAHGARDTCACLTADEVDAERNRV